MNKNKLHELCEEYNMLEERMNKINTEISEIINAVVELNGIKCMVVNFDIANNSIVLKSLNNEKLNKWSSYQTLSIESYSTLI